MRCPFCRDDNDKVIDSRAIDAGRAIRRRRHCLSCGKRFTTYEQLEQSTGLTVIKRDGTRVPFERAKIRAGLEKACYKRPVSAEQLEALVTAVEDELYRRGQREVPALDIGHVTAAGLRELDAVAYVRFASVYKQFQDVGEFAQEAQEVLEHRTRRGTRDQGTLFNA